MSFSMISSQGQGAFGPTGTAAKIANFAGDWASSARSGQRQGNEFLANLLNANVLAGAIEDQPEQRLLGQARTTLGLQNTGNQQFTAGFQSQFNECAATGFASDECKRVYEAATGQRLPTTTQTGTQTTMPTSTLSSSTSDFSPDYSLPPMRLANSMLGL